MGNSDYIFYSVYVESERSYKYICELERGTYISTSMPASCSRSFGLIPYERVLNYIDPTSGTLTRTVLIVREDPSSTEFKGFEIREGTKLCLQEIAGDHVHVFKSEGDDVKAGEKIAYVVTGKLEVRSIRSLCSGHITLIIDITWEKPRRNLLVISSELREVTIRKSS